MNVFHDEACKEFWKRKILKAGTKKEAARKRPLCVLFSSEIILRIHLIHYLGLLTNRLHVYELEQLVNQIWE